MAAGARARARRAAIDFHEAIARRAAAEVDRRARAEAAAAARNAALGPVSDRAGAAERAPLRARPSCTQGDNPQPSSSTLCLPLAR